MVSGRQPGRLRDDAKGALKLGQLKNRFCRCKLRGRFWVSSPGPWKLDPKYIYIYILESSGALRAPLILFDADKGQRDVYTYPRVVTYRHVCLSTMTKLAPRVSPYRCCGKRMSLLLENV